MFFQYDTKGNEKQPGEEESQLWASQLETYLAPYSERLDAYVDRRVVGNLIATVAGIVQMRSELTTSERVGKRDLRASARRSRNAAAPTSAAS
jgi:hypothetical protein